MLNYANTEAGKYLLSELTDRKRIEGNIVKLTPNSYHIQKDKDLYEAHFFCDSPVINKLKIPLIKMDIANEWGYVAYLHHAGLEHSNKHSHVFLDTFNSNAGGDGAMRKHDGTNNITGLRGAASATDLYASNTTVNLCRCSESDRWYLYRGFLPFDTSSIADGANIAESGTKLRIYVNSKGDSTSVGEVVIIQTTQTDSTALALADFNNLTLNTPDEGTASRTTIASITTSAYNEFNANSNFVSWIDKTGYTKLGVREGNFDVDNADVGNETSYHINTNTSDSGSNKPELVVVYSLGGFFAIL